MKLTSLARILVLIVLTASFSASAETWFWRPHTPQSLNHFGASFRAAFNVDVEFQNVGAFAASPPQLTPDGDAYNYDDGYVLVDSSGNMGGYTRYWGYDSASQLPGDGTILMSTYSSAGTTVHPDTDEFEPGVEITYSRTLGGDIDWSWGLETALNYMNASVRDSSAASASVTRQSDAYSLPPLEGGGFVNPPPAPYQGRYDLQPEGNPVIGATPVSSSTSTFMATVGGARRFDADIFGFRLGPFLEMDLGDELKLVVSGGFSLAYVESKFSFAETMVVPGAIPVSGSSSHHDWQPGGYVAGNLTYNFNSTWGAFAGVQYQNVGKYAHRQNNRKVTLDLSESIFVVVGANISF